MWPPSAIYNPVSGCVYYASYDAYHRFVDRSKEQPRSVLAINLIVSLPFSDSPLDNYHSPVECQGQSGFNGALTVVLISSERNLNDLPCGIFYQRQFYPQALAHSSLGTYLPKTNHRQRQLIIDRSCLRLTLPAWHLFKAILHHPMSLIPNPSLFLNPPTSTSCRLHSFRIASHTRIILANSRTRTFKAC